MRLYALAALFFDESWNRHHSSIHSFVHSITRKNRLLAARTHKTHADRYARVDTCYCLTGSWWMTQGWKERGDEGAGIKLCVWWLCVCVVCVSPSLPLLEVFLGSLFLLLREGRDGTGRFCLHSPRSTLFFSPSSSSPLLHYPFTHRSSIFPLPPTLLGSGSLFTKVAIAGF